MFTNSSKQQVAKNKKHVARIKKHEASDKYQKGSKQGLRNKQVMLGLLTTTLGGWMGGGWVGGGCWIFKD